MTMRMTNRDVRLNRRSITAATVMKPNPRSISRNATVREAAEMLHEHGLHIAPVIDDAGRPVGVISRTDLLVYWGRRRDRLAAEAAGETVKSSALRPIESPGADLAVREIMTPVVFGVRSDAPLDCIVEKMAALEVRCLFITDGEGVLVGTVSVFDAIRHVARRNTRSAYVKTPRRKSFPLINNNRLIPASAKPR